LLNVHVCHGRLRNNEYGTHLCVARASEIEYCCPRDRYFVSCDTRSARCDKFLACSTQAGSRTRARHGTCLRFTTAAVMGCG
jgi:hypothetical protein